MALRQRSRAETIRLAKRQNLDPRRVEEILNEIDWLVAEEDQAKTWRSNQTKTKVRSFDRATIRLVDAWKKLPQVRRDRRRLIEAISIIVEESEQTKALLEPGDYRRLDEYRKELAVERAFYLILEIDDPAAKSLERWAEVAAILYGKGTAKGIKRACRKFREECKAVNLWLIDNREVLEAAHLEGLPIVERHRLRGSRKPNFRLGIAPFFKEGEEPTWPVDDPVSFSVQPFPQEPKS
jgi:hypothetical protein